MEHIFRTTARDLSVDRGLRMYMASVYRYMSMGLGLTGAVAFFVSTSPALMQTLLSGPLSLVFLFGPIGIALSMGVGFYRMRASTVQMLFWTYAVLMGVSLSTMFLMFTFESIARVFFISASTFGAMSLYGHSTQKDLSSWGSFLMMGMMGLLLASLVNIFMGSSGFQWVLSLGAVVLFTCLTAYDTQNIKQTYYRVGASGEMSAKFAVFGAMQLYLDFINIFIHLMHILGDRRS